MYVICEWKKKHARLVPSQIYYLFCLPDEHHYERCRSTVLWHMNGSTVPKILHVITRSASVNFMAYVCSFDSKINKFQYEFTCLPHSCIKNWIARFLHSCERNYPEKGNEDKELYLSHCECFDTTSTHYSMALTEKLIVTVHLLQCSFQFVKMYKPTGLPRHRENRKFGSWIFFRQGNTERTYQKLLKCVFHREFTFNMRTVIKFKK